MNTSSVDAFIFAILTTGAVLTVIHLTRLLQTWMQHRTIREAISRDSESVQSLIAGIELDRQPPVGATDDRTAIVLISLGIALFLFGLIQGSAEDLRNVAGAAVFPILVGLGLLVRFYIARRRDRQG